MIGAKKSSVLVIGPETEPFRVFTNVPVTVQKPTWGWGIGVALLAASGVGSGESPAVLFDNGDSGEGEPGLGGMHMQPGTTNMTTIIIKNARNISIKALP